MNADTAAPAATAARLPIAGVTLTLTALVQAASVVPALGRGPGGLLLPALVAGLAIALSLAVTASWTAAPSAAAWTGPDLRLLVWSAGSVVAVSALLVVLPPAALLLLAVLPGPLMTVAAGHPARRTGEAWRRTPGRAVGRALLTLALAVVVWLLAVVLGLVDAGVAGAFAWWVVAGVVQVRVLRMWSRGA
ncbi:hypothetical protein [Pimelobacter simplex]|uniref:hypothetical protein n=1 Tax=Nocardioides simplex TaxID=2045 RepID=UPI002150325A|nr:hypothetical protein [Pimelobacter simplex]UUW88092.1 hypothetical protein M0M43_20440 [Pimelobacter simplex]UUW97596.1 hypothetical protein M0M48_09085 [Pimelobacter simplex]